MCMQPDHADMKNCLRLMSLDCGSLGRMVRSLTLYAVAEHFVSMGEAADRDPAANDAPPVSPLASTASRAPR